MDDKEKQKLKNYVLWLLARQDYSRRELERKLQQKGATADFIEQLLDWCEEHAYVDDARCAENFVRRGVAKFHGMKRIQADARAKGIDNRMLETAFQALEIDWYQLAVEAYNRKFRDAATTLDFKEKGKRMRYLMYRGFNHEQIEFAIANTALDE